MAQVFFSPSAKYCSAIDVVNRNGIGAYSGRTLEQLREEYPDISIVDEQVSIDHDRNRRITAPVEISQEDWYYLLEVLPPCKWGRSASAEAFHISERITYDIVTWAVRIGTKYYRFDDTDKFSATDAIQKVSALHTKEPA
jgi:hypothetical protein